MKESWTMSDERQFMENLVSTRFNFLLIVFSLVVAAAINSESRPELLIVLTIGCVVCSIMSMTVHRAHAKLIQILKLLHDSDGHPVKTIGDKVRQLPLRNRGLQMVWAIGWGIPLACTLCLVVGLVCAWLGLLDALVPERVGCAPWD